MRKQEKAIIIVALVDCVSITIKFILAVFTGSLSLLADAWHSIGDLATSVMVFLALVFDRRETIEDDDEAGVRTVKIIRRSSWEPRACAVIGIALVAVAAGVFRKVTSGGDLVPIRYPVIASLVVMLLMLISYIRFRFEESVGKETGSPALVADAYHSKVDIYALLMVLVSLIGEFIQLRIDRWVAGVIALMILMIALKTIYNAFNVMLRRSNDTDPGKRTVEDVLILLTMGYFFSKKNRLIAWLFDAMNLHSPASTRLWQRRLLGWLSCMLGLFWLGSGFFMVDSREVGIVERFGKPVLTNGPSGPGIHYDWPWPISKVRRVDQATVRWMRLGYQTKERKDTILWTNAHYIREYSVLTGDGAIVDLAADLHYIVKDARAFLYSAVDPEDNLRMISDEVLREIAGKRTLFNVLAHDRVPEELEAQERIQAIADDADLGIRVLQICFLDVHPPMEVAPSFEDVVSSQEDLETYIEQARGYHRERIPLAEAEAYEMKKQSESYRMTEIEKARGRAEAYTVTATAFKLHESVNRHRKRMESLESWLAGKSLWIIDPAVSRMNPDFFMSRSAPKPLADGVKAVSEGDNNIEY